MKNKNLGEKKIHDWSNRSYVGTLGRYAFYLTRFIMLDISYTSRRYKTGVIIAGCIYLYMYMYIWLYKVRFFVCLSKDFGPRRRRHLSLSGFWCWRLVSLGTAICFHFLSSFLTFCLVFYFFLLLLFFIFCLLKQKKCIYKYIYIFIFWHVQ